jgi:hypothetical protein
MAKMRPYLHVPDVLTLSPERGIIDDEFRLSWVGSHQSMVLDKFERYAVSGGPEGLHIEMRQASHCVGFGVFTLVMLAAGWAYSTPLDPGWWAWMGLWMVCGALVAMSALWTEHWQVCSSEVRYQNSFRLKESCIQRFAGKPLALRVESLARASDFDTEKLFPHVVHLIGPDGDEVGDGFAFRRESNLDRFVETLGRVLPLEVDDHRRQKTGVDAAQESPAALWDRWLD